MRYVKLGVSGISYSYPGASRPAVQEFEWELKSGEIAVISGSAGSGKSTFGMLLKGLLQPSNGQIYLVNSEGVRDDSLYVRLNTVGWTTAHPEKQIFARTIEDEVAFAARNQGLDESKVIERVNWSLELVGLTPKTFLKRNPFELSGGEKRRLAIASVISMQCSFYIFDDPTAGLDEDGLNSLTVLLKKIKSIDCGILLIGHDIDFFLEVGDSFYSMESGRLESINHLNNK